MGFQRKKKGIRKRTAEKKNIKKKEIVNQKGDSIW